MRRAPTRTKIVATLGPACGSPEMVHRLMKAGVDVFRLNFSHGDRRTHEGYIRHVRVAADECDANVAVIQDLQGPRIRTGRLRGHEPVRLNEGDEVVLRPGDFEGDARTIPINYDRMAADVSPGDSVLLSDGLIELEVLAADGREACCAVRTCGTLGERKGVNLPGVELSIASPTERDLADLRFGVEHGVDYVALSFVACAADVVRLKKELHSLAPDRSVPVIAKIERPQAVDNLREILAVSDGVMVARGDLGIEMPPEKVPGAQKKIIRMANRMGIPAITATQMLESMIRSPRATRAEASDVANAILDGTDAVMLSGETAVGRHPVEAVAMMDRIARETEALWPEQGGPNPPELEDDAGGRQRAMARAACNIADRLEASGIVTFTMTGGTARLVSQRRPHTPIYALAPDPAACRRLALVWGVRAVMLDVVETTDEMIERGGERLLALGLAGPGDTVVYTAGASTRTPGGTDMLKVHRFEGAD